MKFIKDKNVLVTGGTGFVGSHLVERLIQEQSHVITTTQRFDPSSYFFSLGLDKKCVIEAVDIIDYDDVLNIVTKHDVEYIFHLAAQPLVEVAYHNPRRTLESNINGTINILESARLFPKVKAVIVASSDKAYGKLTKEKYTEGDPLLGDHPYEVSKSAADLICYSYFKTYGVPVVTTRFGNIYGEGDLNYSRIIPGALKSLIMKDTLGLRSDGTYTRDYLYVKDVVEGYLLLASKIDSCKGKAYNFGSDDTLKVIELLEIMQDSLKKKIPYKILDNAKNEIPYQSLDYSKIQKQFGWKPRHTVRSTMKHIYQWYRKHISL